MPSENSNDSDSSPLGVIRQYFRERLPKAAAGDLGDDEALISSGLMTSLSTLELVSMLEDTFDIEIPAHEIRVENLDTVARIVAIVEEKRNS